MSGKIEELETRKTEEFERTMNLFISSSNSQKVCPKKLKFSSRKCKAPFQNPERFLQASETFVPRLLLLFHQQV
jgi:hypothetical protein